MRRDRSRSWRTRALVLATVLVSGGSAGIWGTGCGTDNSIVGGSCAAGLTDCDNVCVQLSSDPNNCGACGNVCASGSCVDGKCSAARGSHPDASRDARSDGRADAMRDGGKHDGVANDAPTRDGASEDATPDGASQDGSRIPRDAAHHDGAQTDGAPPDGVTSDAPIADGSVDQCAPPYITTASCGACGVACGPTDVCTPVLDAGADGGTYVCAPLCPSPLVDCGGTCVDETSDPDNCGGCGMTCASGICVDSMCAGTTSGDIVVIGHDYASSSSHVSEAKIVSNAVFLPPTNPLRVLSFEQYAIAAQVTNVKAILKQAALASGRTLNLTVVSDSTAIPSDLASGSYDVLLVYDQGNAPASTLLGVGQTWQSSIGTFVAVGGDVVVLDGASGAHPQMTDLLSASGLLQTTAETTITQNTELHVVASADAVGSFVISPYAAQKDTVSFVTSEMNGGSVIYVVEQIDDAGSAPVVIHKSAPTP